MFTGCGLVPVAMETKRNVLSLTRSQFPPVREHKEAYSRQSSSTLPQSRTGSSQGIASPCPSCALLQESVRENQLQNAVLTRNLGHILASLKSAKDLITSLERSLEKKRSPSPRMTPEPPPMLSPLSPSQPAPVTDDGLLHANIVDSLYPPVDNSLVPELTQTVAEINSIISEAADKCLSSAGTSFSASIASNRAISASTPTRRKLSRMQTLPSFYPPPMLPSSITSEARNIPEDQVCTPTNCSSNELSNSESRSSLRRTLSDTCLDSSGDDFDTLGELMDSNLQLQQRRRDQFHSHFLSLLDKQRRNSEFMISDSLASVVSPEPPLEERKDYIVSLGNGLSGEESKQLLEKIAVMENDRLKSMTEIEELRDENASLWDSVVDLSHDVDNKSLHLQLAMQDLRMATNEIKKSTELKQRVDELINERDTLRARLTNLEDEGVAVKESLVQLLQEKSATNRTLTLENQRLRTKMVQIRSASGPAAMGQQISQTSLIDLGDAPEFIDDDVINADDNGQYVHRSGFLVKQGGRIKSWKKRLFVLTNNSLAYFKTEEAVGTIALEAITKVNLQHGHTLRPNMFEVHTQGGRVYNLSAQSHSDMQHWMGMIQTLIHSRNQTLRKSLHKQDRISVKFASLDEGSHAPPSSSPPTKDLSYPPPGYQAVKQHRSRTTINSFSVRVSLPPDDADVSRKRMFSAARTAPLVIASMDVTDEEDLEDNDKDGRSPFVSSDEESRSDRRPHS